jgi:hypothetical protein
MLSVIQGKPKPFYPRYFCIIVNLASEINDAFVQSSLPEIQDRKRKNKYRQTFLPGMGNSRKCARCLFFPSI